MEFYVSDLIATPPDAFETPLQQLVYDTFAAAGIPFERVDTDPGLTMEDCAHISARIGVDIVNCATVSRPSSTSMSLRTTSRS